MAKPELVNAVGGGDLSQEIDLKRFYETIDGEEVRYDPEHWPGLYLRFTTESPAVMVFRTGKYNIAGADSLEELFDTNEKFLSRIQELGINYEESSFEVRNLVFLEQYDKELNLGAVTVALGL